MISNEEYQKITKDIAGSRTKSRFTYEIAHGVNMIYEEYQKDGDFFIIFDYSCDIEKGREDKISFYQLKTKTTGNYTIDALLKIPPQKTKSILQTLIDLKRTSSVDKLYIVSNSPLSGENYIKPISNFECVSFGLLSDDTKKKINDNIVWPLGKADFDNLYFCVSDIMVKAADNSLIGLTHKFLNNIYPASFTNPSNFKKSIMNFAREKADFEMDTSTLEETIAKKGITRKDVDKLLDEYRKAIVQSVIPPFEIVSKWIDRLKLKTNIAIKVKTNYTVKFNKAFLTEEEKKLIKEIYLLYENVYGELSPEDAVQMVVSNFPSNDFVFELEDKYLFAIMSFESGGNVK